MTNVSKWIQCIGFVAVGIVANIIGPLLPAIRTDISINYSQGGLLLSGQFIGMLFTALIGGYFMDKAGKRPFMIAGGIMLIVGLSGCMTATGFGFLYVLNLVTGFGYGIFEVGINALCADSLEENKGSGMNFVHFFYGIGAIIAPLIAFVSTEYLGNWRYCFGFALIAPVIVSLLLIRNKIEDRKAIGEETVHGANADVNPLKSLFLWTIGLAVFFYVGVEVSTGGWITVYWDTVIPGSVIPASLTATVFWLCLTAGRLISGRIADRIGLMTYLFAAGTGTMLLTALWSILPAGNWTIIIIGLLGLMLSGQFPTTMVVATSHFPGKSGTTAAFISVFAGLSGFFLPAAVGRAADIFSIAVLSYSMLILSLLLVIFVHTYKKGSMKA